MIDEQNYEEYFLLHVDDELDEAQSAELDAFLREHPELRPDLDALLGTRLAPEPLVFGEQQLLLRPVDDPTETGVRKRIPLLRPGLAAAAAVLALIATYALLHTSPDRPPLPTAAAPHSAQAPSVTPTPTAPAPIPASVPVLAATLPKHITSRRHPDPHPSEPRALRPHEEVLPVAAAPDRPLRAEMRYAFAFYEAPVIALAPVLITPQDAPGQRFGGLLGDQVVIAGAVDLYRRRVQQLRGNLKSLKDTQVNLCLGNKTIASINF